MLFNSDEFLLLFLPLCFFSFWAAARSSRSRALSVLLFFSTIFYTAWNPKLTLLLLLSICLNYWLSRAAYKKAAYAVPLACVFNLGLLIYFKYTDFFIVNANQVLGTQISTLGLMLPLGISFFTFQQLAAVIDSSHQKVNPENFRDYALFVVFFPQLIAGPIVHYRELTFEFNKDFFWSNERISQGLLRLILGLGKKVLIADHFSIYADQFFSAAANNGDIGTISAWAGTLCYTLQLYFDFSGYSDMGKGLANLFNITIPENFNSPYKAISITDFWRRWHITLSHFLRDYLYIPLGGNRQGNNRRLINLMITMGLGGLWHGAGWQFLLWGLIHGFLLVAHQLWNKLKPANFTVPVILARTLTFLCVVIAWVFFRADSFQTAQHVLVNMFTFKATLSIPSQTLLIQIFVGLLAVWFLPNSRELGAKFNLHMQRPKSLQAATYGVCAAGLAWLILIHLSREAKFLYFQF